VKGFIPIFILLLWKKRASYAPYHKGPFGILNLLDAFLSPQAHFSSSSEQIREEVIKKKYFLRIKNKMHEDEEPEQRPIPNT
jgi:hypothetical protein